MERMKKTWIGAALLAGCCIVMTGCKGEPQAAMPVQSYPVITVAPSSATVEASYSATIRGRQDIDILPQVSGTISKLCVTEGQTVSQGQALFVIDQVPYKAALQTAEANVKLARANVSTAQLTYDSKKELRARDIISDYDLQTANNTLLSAQASLAQAEAQLVNARNNLGYTVVKAPARGVVGTLPYRVGALVGPSIPVALTTVSDNSTMYVYFSMAEKEVLKLTRRYGSMAEALKQMPAVTLKLSDGSTYEEQGRIESISGVIDRQTGSVQLRAAFANKNGVLRSGGSGSVVIPQTLTDHIVVPQAATFEIQDKIYVYKVVDGKATSSMIEVLDQNDGRSYIVLSGLNAGDVIVAEGVGLLREGTPVTPRAEAPAQEAQKVENKEE